MTKMTQIKKLLAQMPVVANTPEKVPAKRTSSLERYLSQHYDFRINLLTDETEFRPVGEADYQILGKRELNTLAFEISRNGVSCGFGALSRYLQSSLIETYHPFEQYLKNLPRWDGKDRVTDLAMRVSRHPLWLKGFRRWMLAMVAQWMGMDKLHANSVAPLLISEEQGMMKSTFCKSLMPEALQNYYTDKADLSAQGFLEHKLALMGIINLDEFDSIPEQRMAQLKNLMQMPAVTIRQAYRKNFRQLPRIASFIGTSNRPDLLTDPTGSRRFVCIEVRQKIDCSNLEMDQVYAQLKAEIGSGERHWFTSAEEREILEHNASFRQIRPEEELLRAYYRAPLPDEEPEILSLVEIMDGLRSEHAHLLRRCDMKRFGIILQTLGMEKVHTRNGNRYKVVRM